jgi:hypothetical protein
VLAFAHVLYLLADELACLGGWRLALPLRFPGTFQGFLLGHEVPRVGYQAGKAAEASAANAAHSNMSY